MTFRQFMRLGLGLAASSGAALVLSGSAFAAEGGAGTTSQPITGASTRVAPVVTAPQVKTVVQDAQASLKTPVVGSQGDDVTPAGGNKGDNSTTSGVAPNVSAPSDGSGTASTPTNDAATSGLVPATVTPSDDGVVNGTSTVAPSVVLPTPPVDVMPAQVAPTVIAKPQTVMIDATAMSVQPTITANAANLAMSDLAMAVPSAPTPVKVPVPTKPSGWLGQLTAGLASMVVPQLLPVVGDVVMRVVVGGWPVLAGSLLGVFVFGYGLWLRRSGFVNAARSDVSDIIALVSSIIDTSYVGLVTLLHSSFLMVVGLRPVTLRGDML